MTTHQSARSTKFQNVMITLITALVSGAFVFLWNLNAAIAEIKQRDTDKTQQIGDIRNDVNKVRLDIVDLKISQAQVQTKLETIKKQ